MTDISKYDIPKMLIQIGMTFGKLDEAVIKDGGINPIYSMLTDNGVEKLGNGIVRYSIDGNVYIVFEKTCNYIKMDATLFECSIYRYTTMNRKICMEVYVESDGLIPVIINEQGNVKLDRGKCYRSNIKWFIEKVGCSRIFILIVTILIILTGAVSSGVILALYKVG